MIMHNKTGGKYSKIKGQIIPEAQVIAVSPMSFS